MAKTERPVEVEIPRAGADNPAWSRVGLIGLAGFVIGIAWPRIAGVKIGPSVPSDLRTQVEATASPSSSAAAPPALSGSAAAPPVPAPSGSAAVEAPAPANQELVVVGPGKITKCYDRKDKKIDDCEKLQFDPLAIKKLKELSTCSSAVGLSGKVTLGFDVDFDKREVHVVKAKKGGSLPTTTVNGLLQCAARGFGNAALDEVPHKYKHYTLTYALNFYPPGKHPLEVGGSAPKPPDGAEDGDKGGDDGAAGATTSETEASGTAVVNVDAAPLRKEPKGKEKVGRLVRGTKVKILGKQNDWYKVESGANVGWVYRGAIGL